MTQGQFDTLLSIIPEDGLLTTAQRDPQRFLNLYGVMLKAMTAFKSQHLEDKSPYKQGLDFVMMKAMADYYVQDSTRAITVSPEEIEKYYNDHKDVYKKFKISGIEVAFGADPAAEAEASSVMASRIPKKTRTEDEAKAKAQQLVAQLRAGADFAKLMQTESDDENLKAKGGDLGTWAMTDNIPDFLRSNVMSLKEGEVSEPIRQAGGFYIVHVDAITYTPLADVRDSIFAQLQKTKGTDWLNKFAQDVKVEFPTKPEQVPSADPKK